MDINVHLKITDYTRSRILRIFILFSVIFTAFGSTLLSQDIHYSQFYNAPLTLNPALTGIFRGDIRFQANYRNQWRSVPVDFVTFTAAADMKFLRRPYKRGFFSGGVIFNPAPAVLLTFGSLG